VPTEFLKMANGMVNFKIHLEKHGIKPILARIKHPQTNGKLEKWFDMYKKV
jgi:transposase InsO family protein